MLLSQENQDTEGNDCQITKMEHDIQIITQNIGGAAQANKLHHYVPSVE